MRPDIAMRYGGRPGAKYAGRVPAYFEIQQNHEREVGIDFPRAYCLVAAWLDAIVG